MVSEIRKIEKFQAKKKNITFEEKSNKKSARKSIFVKKNLLKGHILKYSDLSFKKPGIGINQWNLEK